MTSLSLHSAVVFRYRISGWIISFVGHVAIAAAAIFMLSDLRLATQPEPFRWQVSVSQHVPSQQQIKTPQPQSDPRPAPKPTPAPKPVQKPSVPTQQQRVEVHPVTQTVQAVTSVTHQEVRKVEPVVKSEHSVSETVESKAPVTREMESVNQTAETRLTAAKPVAEPVTEEIVSQSQQVVAETSSVVTQEVMDRADSTVTEQTPIAEKTVANVATPTIESAPAPIETAAVQTRPPADSSLSEAALETVPVETSKIVEAPAIHKTPAAEPSDVQPTQTAPLQQASIQNPPAQSLPARKADYSWLLETLWSRVEQLKRYPYVARVNRWEGLVVLLAVIDHNGQLLDLKVAESSGHAVLDQDAMDVLRKSCPLHLKHPLGKPHVELRVPISYKLR